ncbi:MAG: AAA family ATPase [Methanomicrobiales archaeon]|nr:AAA family ATPase [Methanomicrobiales archaeon]
MRIEELTVKQFKTFRELKLELDPYNVIIGINAAGKSNFIDIFRFLRDIAARGIADAISLQGGVDCLRNLCIASDEPLCIEMKVECRSKPLRFQLCVEEARFMEIEVDSWSYGLRIPVIHSIPPLEERVSASCRFRRIPLPGKEISTVEGEISISRNSEGELEYRILPPEADAIVRSLSGQPERISTERSILEEPFCIPFFSPLIYTIRIFFANMGIYDIDPNLSKRLSLTGPVTLEPDGSNLAISLQHLLMDERKKEELLVLLNDILPFVEDVEVSTFQGLSPVASLRESYCGGRFTPANLLSTGTVHLTALLLILYFEDRVPIVLEEPVRNLHPFLASRIMEMIRDVSIRLERQVILTTHHPTIVKHAGERILLVKRDALGYSCIIRPHERDEVRAFLQDLGIEDLFVQNLL